MLSVTNTGRNDPCPCLSGNKYKKCCPTKDEAAERERLAEA
jgi:SEC-C motif